MLGTFKMLAVLAIIPTTIFLTISFFVLVIVRKVDGQGLKAFGYVVAACLWASAIVIFSSGVYMALTGKHFMKYKMMCPMMSDSLEMKCMKDKMMEEEPSSDMKMHHRR